MTVSQLSARLTGRVTYEAPFTTEDGSTVVPVNRVHGQSSTPVGIFLVHAGTAAWVPAVDHNRIATIGVCTGLVAATLGCLAVLRKPPWPDTVIRITKNG